MRCDMSTKSSSTSLLIRIYHDSSDPRHQVIADWYRNLPAGPQGRKRGVQETLIGLLYESIVSDAHYSQRETPIAQPVGSAAPHGSRGLAAGKNNIRTPDSTADKPHPKPTTEAKEEAQRMLRAMKF